MIRVDVKDYCQSCLDFDSDIEKPTVLYVNGEALTQMGDTIIRCSHRHRCETIKRYIEQEKEKNDDSN